MDTTLSVIKISSVSSHQEETLQKAYQIHQQVTYSPWRFATFTDCTTRPYQMVVLTDGQDIRGYAMILLVADEATLMDLGVCGVSRGKGYGKCLLQKVIQICTKKRMATLWLEVRMSNEVAKNLYVSHGFTVQEVRKNYYDSDSGKEDAVIMKYPINAVPASGSQC